MSRRRILSIVLAFAAAASSPSWAQEGKSLLRLQCDEDATGATVTINGEFRGECPLDVTVSPGTVKLRAVQSVGPDKERVFETEIRIGPSSAVRREVTLGPPRLTAQGQRRADEAARIAAERERRRQAEEQALRQALADDDATHGLYCFAGLLSSKSGFETFTPIFEFESRDRGRPMQLAAAQAFVTAMRSSDSSWFAWNDFASNVSWLQAANGAMTLSADRSKDPTFGKFEIQRVTQRCYPTREQAQQGYKLSRQRGAAGTAWIPAGTRAVPSEPAIAPVERLHCFANIYKQQPGVQATMPVWEFPATEVKQDVLEAWLMQFAEAMHAAVPQVWRPEARSIATRTCGVLSQGGRCIGTGVFQQGSTVDFTFVDVECHDKALPAFRARKAFTDGAVFDRIQSGEAAWAPAGARPAVFDPAR